MKLAIVNDSVVTSIVTIQDEDTDSYLRYVNNCQIALQIDNLVPQPQIGWKFDGSKLIPGVSSNEAEFVMQTVYDPLTAEFAKIKRQFIGENIFWGIDYYGKTEAVGDFMEPIEKWFNRIAPKETIKQIEIAKIALSNDQALASNLAPYITIDRLNWYRNSILQALAKIKG